MRAPQLPESSLLRRGVLTAALGAVLLPAPASPAAAGPEGAVEGTRRPAQDRTLTESFDPGDYRAVTLEVKVGEINVRGSADDRIVLSVRIECEWDDAADCRDRVEDVRIVPSDWGDDLYLGIEGLGFWGSRGVHLEIDLTLPARMPVALEVGVGEVEIADLLGDVTVDLGVGEIDITMDAAAVASVTLDNGIGESRLRYPDGKQDVSGILGGTEVYWDLGAGDHAVKVELNVGEIRVTLR